MPFVFAQYGHDELQGGNKLIFVPGLRMHFTRQGFFRIDGLFGQEPWAQQTFKPRNIRVFGQAQFTRWLNIYAQVERGRSIYYDQVNPFLGRYRSYHTDVSLQPSARFNQALTYDRVEFDRPTDGSRVYTVNVVNTRTTFQLNRRFSVRAIVQYDSSLETGPDRLSGLVGAVAGHGRLRGVRVTHRAAVLGRPAVHPDVGRVSHDGARPVLQGVVRASILGRVRRALAFESYGQPRSSRAHTLWCRAWEVARQQAPPDAASRIAPRAGRWSPEARQAAWPGCPQAAGRPA